MFQAAAFSKITLCFNTLFVVLTVIFKSHLGDEKEVGFALNFAAAVVIIEFNDFIGKFFIILKHKNEYNEFEKFLTIQISNKIYGTAKLFGVPVYFLSF